MATIRKTHEYRLTKENGSHETIYASRVVAQPSGALFIYNEYDVGGTALVGVYGPGYRKFERISEDGIILEGR